MEEIKKNERDENKIQIGIVGYGHVGKAMHNLFKNANIYDKKIEKLSSQEHINKINQCDAVFICVPTPQNEDGSCDTSIVEEVISWCTSKLIILRSTVRVGFTREMREKFKKEIVFQPEYYGETVAHPFTDLNTRNWLSFGGTRKGINLAIDVYKTVINSDVRIYQASSDEVEKAKYMENAYLATKVTFCNEMFDICKKLNLDYNVIREIWIADPRIGSSHTFVYDDKRGWGGSCLPKDISSLIHQAKENKVDVTFLEEMVNKNNKYQK